MTSLRLRSLLSGPGSGGKALLCPARGGGAGKQAGKHGWFGALNLEDLGAARCPGDQRHGAPTEAKRGGHGGEHRLGRLAVYGPRTDPDDQGTVALPAHSGPGRAGSHPDGDPHDTSVPRDLAAGLNGRAQRQGSTAGLSGDAQ